jgi:hypothetical protein
MEDHKCNRCIMPRNFPSLRFDSGGTCDLCCNGDPSSGVDLSQRRIELNRRIEHARQEATRYHAIVPWSGGKDSTYVLYVLINVYGLRVLAVNFDNGFKSRWAHINLDKISRRLGIDLVTIRLDWTLMRDLYSHYLRERGELCSVCNMVGYVVVFSFVLKESRGLGYFPLVVGGWSGRHENVRSIFTFDYAEFRRVIEGKKDLLQRFEANPMVDREVCEILQCRGDPRAGSAHIGEDLGRRFFQLPDFLDWDVAEIREVLSKELDWLSSGSAFPAHEDCDWHRSMKYLMFQKYGFDNHTIALSAMVRSGRLTRERALEIEREGNAGREPEDMSALLGSLGCGIDDINRGSDWYTGQNVGETYGGARGIRQEANDRR